MGTVYKAVHTRMGRTCAIKVLTPLTTDMQTATARFNREARMASRIDNPHAVFIHDFGEAEGNTLYLAMEFIDGISLKRLIAEEWPLGMNRIVAITDQIAEALSAAHALGIIHRDLKPDNIMITSKEGASDYVKVLDFGIAKLVADSGIDSVTGTGIVIGTPVYMSPEQVAGENLDARSDVYSLALIVYEMLTRRLPFEGHSPQSIMVRRLTNDPIPMRKLNPSISRAVERAVMRGLASDPEARTQTAGEFAYNLSGAARQETQPLVGKLTDKEPREKAYPTTVVAFANGERVHNKEATISRQPRQTAHYYKGGGPISRRLLLTGRLNWKHYSAAAVIVLLLISVPFAIIAIRNGELRPPQTAQPSDSSGPPQPAAEQKGESSKTPEMKPVESAPAPSVATERAEKPSSERRRANTSRASSNANVSRPEAPAVTEEKVEANLQPTNANRPVDETKKEEKKKGPGIGGFFKKIFQSSNANVKKEEKKP